MRSFTSKPILLVLTLLLIVGAIVFIEARFQNAGTGDSATAEVPAGDSTTAESTSDGVTTAEETTAEETTPEETNASTQPGPEPTEQPSTTESQPASDAEDAAAQRLAEKAAEYPRAEEITDPTGFINTNGVSIGDARGEKVILLDFWTYSCINCQNTQPYLNAWQERYADDGLQIIGVHKPEFGFEKNPANVAAAVREAGIQYPVVIDNNDATWDAYDQSYWPTMYLIDADGFVRYKHIGEGAYKDTEAKIQELLAEKNSSGT